MPKTHKDKSYISVSSTISVLRSDVAVDMIEIIRENLIKNYREGASREQGQDIELTSNVFAYLTGEGLKHLEVFEEKLKERAELLIEKDKDHKKVMKKEWKNLKDQANAYERLGKGLKEASNQKVNVINRTIKIEGPIH